MHWLIFKKVKQRLEFELKSIDHIIEICLCTSLRVFNAIRTRIINYETKEEI